MCRGAGVFDVRWNSRIFWGAEGQGAKRATARWSLIQGLARRVLRLGFLGILLLGQACTPLDDAMVAIFGRSMRDQSSFDPYEHPLAAPENSVPFSAGNLAREGEVNVGQPEELQDPPPPFTQIDVLNNADVVVNLPNPVPVTEASIARGEELFLRFCAPCHGPNAAGVTGYIIPAGFPPYPLLTDRVRGFTDGYIYGMIRMGRGLMPAYGSRITHFDRWNVVNYLRVLQGVVPAAAGSGAQDSPARRGPASTDTTEGASSSGDGATSS